MILPPANTYAAHENLLEHTCKGRVTYQNSDLWTKKQVRHQLLVRPEQLNPLPEISFNYIAGERIALTAVRNIFESGKLTNSSSIISAHIYETDATDRALH